jgi:uncharacterized protein
MIRSFLRRFLPQNQANWQGWSMVVVLLWAHLLYAQDIPPQPNPPRMVNDFVMKLSPQEQASLEKKLRYYRDSTSTEISVVIVKTTQPYPLLDYGVKLGKTWGIGQKGKNNGVILLWATDDRRIRILTGYGMEGVLPDAISKRIQNEIIVPLFKQERYFDGLDQGIDAIIKRATGEYKNENQGQSEDGDSGLFILIFFILFIVIIIWISRRGGGGGGGYRQYRDDGWYPPITISSWGSSSGSGWGGGGSSDDGPSFGGFGGGDFGGGGAESGY